MDAGWSSTRILIVPRPRAGAALPSVQRGTRTVIRSVRRVAPRSTAEVLLRAAREVRDPRWSPAGAGHALVAHVGGETGPLRAARVHLLAATLDRRTRAESRALASIDAAIAEIEAGQRPRPRSTTR